MVNIKCGDCIEFMKEMNDKSVDMILTDPPYGTTKNSWDKRVPLDLMWEQFNRVIKPNGAIVIFAQMPYGAELICSNRKMFRYELIWEKTSAAGFLNANRMPLRAHENILVFYKSLPTYNPQFMQGNPYKSMSGARTTNYGSYARTETINGGTRYPRDVIKMSRDSNNTHPTQKPVALCEYLIRTYTNEGDTVLDPFMGSGSTGVAAINTGRDFVGIELDKKYYELAKQRLTTMDKCDIIES